MITCRCDAEEDGAEKTSTQSESRSGSKDMVRRSTLGKRAEGRYDFKLLQPTSGDELRIKPSALRELVDNSFPEGPFRLQIWN